MSCFFLATNLRFGFERVRSQGVASKPFGRFSGKKVHWTFFYFRFTLSRTRSVVAAASQRRPQDDRNLSRTLLHEKASTKWMLFHDKRLLFQQKKEGIVKFHNVGLL